MKKKETTVKPKTVKTKAVNKKAAPINPERVETVAPKYHFANQVRELFKRDPEIKMTFDEKKCIINMSVDNEIKALAIRRLLPETREFVDGKVTINVKLRQDRFGGDTYLPQTVYEALKGNPLARYIHWWEDPEDMTNPACWVVMEPEIVAYPESDGHQIYGSRIELPENLATTILGYTTDMVYYCTDDNNPEHPMPDENSKRFND